MNEQITQIYGYLHGMWKYRWSALIITWVIAIIGWTVTLTIPNQYSTSAVVFVDTTSIMKPLLKGLAPETNAEDELNVMTRMLLSRKNLMAVIRDTDMDLDIDSPAAREEMITDLAGAIVITGGGGKKRWEKKSNIYEISYESDSADRVYQVVSNLLNTMIEDTLSSTRTDTASAQKFLDMQISEYEERLSLAEQKLAEFKKANVGFMPDEKGSYYSRLQKAQDKVVAKSAELRMAEQRLKELNRQLGGESQILSQQDAASLKLAKYRQELEALLTIYTDQHPDVIVVQQNIEDLERRIEQGLDVSDEGSAEYNPVYQELKVATSRAGIDVEVVRTELSESESYVAKLRESVDLIPEVEAELSKLNRDYNVTRDRYLDLVERREAARLAQDAGQSTSDVSFRVIEPPIVPVSPSGPDRTLYQIMVLLMSCAAGLGWCMLRYLLRPTFFMREQARDILDIPVLGTVNLYMTPGHRRQRKKQLTTFLSATAMLLVVFAGTFVYRFI